MVNNGIQHSQRSVGKGEISTMVADPIQGKVGNRGIAGRVTDEGREAPKTGRKALCTREKTSFSSDIGQGGEDVAHAQSKREVCGDKSENGQRAWIDESGENVGDTTKRRLEKYELRQMDKKSSERCWWATEPDLGRVAHGVAHRVDRLKALGEGQVPLVVSTVWSLLFGEE